MHRIFLNGNQLHKGSVIKSIPIRLYCVLLSVFFGCAGYVYEGTQKAETLRHQLDGRRDIARQYLMAGTEYQTSLYLFDSGVPGPSVLILGGTHGDEPAGYEAALRLVDRFCSETLLRGKLYIIPEANRNSVQHYRRRIRVPYGNDIERGNLNRSYPGKADGLPMEQLAFQIGQLVLDNDISVLIDLHEALNFHLDIEESADRKGLGQTIIYYPNEPSAWLLMNLLSEINQTISDNRQKFSALEQPIEHSASWWAGKYAGIAGFTFETARKNPLDIRIGYHLKLVGIALRTEGMI